MLSRVGLDGGDGAVLRLRDLDELLGAAPVGRRQGQVVADQVQERLAGGKDLAE